MKLDACRIEQGRLVFDTTDPAARRLAYGFKAGEYDIVPVKKKRSKNANDYMWALATEIGAAVGRTKEEVYRDAIKEVGVFKDFHDIRPEDAPSLMTAWQRLGTGWISERVDWETDGDHVIVRAYYGSSQYNTKQMSRLVDWMTQEAHNVGVETLDDLKVKGLLEEWKREERIRSRA